MFVRMFGTGLDTGVTKATARGEYLVAQGVTSEIFRTILVISFAIQLFVDCKY